MSVEDIIEELPKLTHHQRREICQKIIAMEAEQEELLACDQAADAAFAELDRLESESSSNEGR